MTEEFSPARRVFAVVVAYHPERARFAALLAALAGQVESMVVADNGGDAVAPGCTVLAQPGNVGVAAAQNAGIRAALAGGADAVLLLDHDSIPAPDMVARLREALGEGVAAAGPVYRDEDAGTDSWFVRFGRFGFVRERCAQAHGTVEADFLIASGTLLAARALREVGEMDASLFIDHVDTDWCLRARAQGWRLVGACAARMSHRLGERAVKLAGGRPFYVHGPARHYYTFRNSALLHRRPHATARWAFGDRMRLLKLLFAMALFAPPRLANLRAALRGYRDGRRGVKGTASEERSRKRPR